MTKQESRIIEIINKVIDHWGAAPPDSAWKKITKQDEDTICANMPDIAACVQFIDTQYVLDEFDKYKSLDEVFNTLKKALIETDPTFEAAYFCHSLGMATVDEYNRGVNKCSQSMMVTAARIAIRCHLYKHNRTKQVIEQARALRALMVSDVGHYLQHVKDNPPDAVTLIALAAPVDDVISSLNKEQASTAASARSKGRNDQTWQRVRSLYDELNRSVPSAKALSIQIAQTLREEKTARPLSLPTIRDKIYSWRSETH